ncbi:MAG: Mth938-like domain-containing protein [Georgfuchsia sp.]
MKLQAERPQGQNAITAYGPGSVTINEQIYLCSLIVSHDRLLPDWPVAKLEDLTSEHLLEIYQGYDVILLGTGSRQRFPHRSILHPLFEKRIGIEVMDTAAACRTYNLLLTEGRAVVAALIIE